MDGTWRLRVLYAPYKGARGIKLKTASSIDVGYERTWATQAAAIAAKSNLSRNGLTAAAAVSSG